MLYTLNKIASIILRTLNGGEMATESKFERREIIQRVRQTMAELLKLEIVNKRNFEPSDRTPVEMYIATYNLKVTDKKLTMPDPYMTLAYQAGIREVFTRNLSNSSKKIRFMKMPNPGVTESIWRKDCKPESYYVEGYSIFVDARDQNLVKNEREFVVKAMVPAPSTVGIDDPLPVTVEQVNQMKRMIVADMQPQLTIPQDDQEDLTPEQVDG